MVWVPKGRKVNNNHVALMPDAHQGYGMPIGGVVAAEANFLRTIDIHHNYAACEEHFGRKVFVHRKGATSAKLDEIGVIPGSMGTASYIVRGLGNPDSFTSCSHGAGRRHSMPRPAAEGRVIRHRGRDERR